MARSGPPRPLRPNGRATRGDSDEGPSGRWGAFFAPARRTYLTCFLKVPPRRWTRLGGIVAAARRPVALRTVEATRPRFGRDGRYSMWRAAAPMTPAARPSAASATRAERP